MEVDSAKAEIPAADEYDVVIVGGGASGLAAGVFTARYGFETLIYDRGPSALRQSYYIGNYLGFLGIDPETFLRLGRSHATFEGCEIIDDLVVAVERADGQYQVRTQGGTSVEADYLIAASAYKADYLSDVADGEFHEEGEHPVECDEATGRTEIDGLYVAGWLSGGPHQALISAGHGARVAKTLIEDYRISEREHWDGIADYWDWCVEEGTYGDEEWNEHVDEWINSTIPEDEDVAPERIDRIRTKIKQERLSFEQSTEERSRRVKRSQELLTTYFIEDEPE